MNSSVSRKLDCRGCVRVDYNNDQSQKKENGIHCRPGGCALRCKQISISNKAQPDRL